MRIIFYNPHVTNDLGVTLVDFISRNYSFKRYKYLIDYSQKKQKIYFCVSRGSSSLPNYISRFFPQRLEVFLWLVINRINPWKVGIIYGVGELKKSDIFVAFSLSNLEQSNIGLEDIKDKKILKVFHMTHYAQNTSIIANNLKKLNVNLLIAENNLAKNSKYFQKMFPDFKTVYVLPYVFQSRFKRYKKFSQRINKCLATGTLIIIKEFEINKKIFKDFSNFYKLDTLHPMREEIYNNPEKLRDLVDSYISNFWEIKRKKWEKVGNPLLRWRMRFWNAAFATRRSYLKFDIVEKYNQYKMFIVPEEVCDVPGIGFVEGMACGSAYIGKIDPMYTDLGLIPGKHYIGYDGTLADLVRKIKYFQRNEKALEKVANNGYKFVVKEFNGDKIAKKFFEDLERMNTKFRKNGMLN